ncbi:hypothetical protein [Mycobacterium sp.]|uniref:hypothetical protein n=1 Tax=Mycobacterium sp. TaxID=1785 RepID=UPI002BAF8B1D|nr:hypothetical protein [Mycobacterium sp.]HTY35428.1 hypothetical protein [Mycobacterium sp.]
MGRTSTLGGPSTSDGAGVPSSNVTSRLVGADGQSRLVSEALPVPLPVAQGGTGATTPAAAQTALGLGSAATKTPAQLAADAAFTGVYASIYTVAGPYLAAREYALLGSQSFAVTNFDRGTGTDQAGALTSAVMTSVALYLLAGSVVTNLTFISGNTAANAPANWWFALYDTQATPALLGQTTDQTTAAWAANTAKTLALSSPVSITTTGVYYAACMVKATGVPSLLARATYVSGAGAVIAGAKVLAQTSGAALTTTAPATIATPTTTGVTPFVIAT